jgi:drug/metabolite transporter (DMT)-like permease
MADRIALFLLIGTAASVLLAVGLVIMKSRSAALPAIEGLRGLRTAIGWLRDPIWAAGIVIQTAGFALYMIALSGAPVSMLAVMMQGNVAVFVLFAALFLHERAGVGEWLAIGAVVAAILLLAMSLHGGAAEHPGDRRMLGIILFFGVLLAALPHLSARLRTSGIAPALASGVAFGLGSLYAKAVTDAYAAAPHAPVAAVFAGPWLYLTIATNVGGLVLLQNSFHWARGIIAMPLSSACSNLVPIIGGILAFGERLPADPPSAMLRLSAFALTIVAGGFLATAE